MKTLLAVILVFFYQCAGATTQEPEIFINNSRQLVLLSQPLDSDDGVQTKLTEAINSSVGTVRRTSLYRGYRGYWQIARQTLELVRIEAPQGNEWKNIPLNLLYPGYLTDVPALWFSGELLVGHGEEIMCDPPSFKICFESYEVIMVDHGRIMSTTEKKLLGKK